MREDQLAEAILYQLTRIADADEKKLYQQTRMADSLASISMMAETEREEWRGTAYEYEPAAPSPEDKEP